MSPRRRLLLLLSILLPLLSLIIAAPTPALVLRTADPGLQLDSISHHHIHRQWELNRQQHTPISRPDGAAPPDLSPTTSSATSSVTTTPTTSPPQSPKSNPRKNSKRTQKRQAPDIGAGIDGLSKRTKIIIGATIATVFAAFILMCVVRSQMGKDPCPCRDLPSGCAC